MRTFRNVFDRVQKQTGMYLQEESYGAVAAFVLGYDLACQGGVLTGFREWLIVRLNTGNNLTWTALVLHAAFPDTPNPQAAVESNALAQRHAIDALFQLISEFDDVRCTPDGLRKIYAEYQSWLQNQDWYKP